MSRIKPGASGRSRRRPGCRRCDSNGGRISGICLERCTYELRQAQAMYAANGLPVINSTTKSVEEMSTLIVQTLSGRPSKGTT